MLRAVALLALSATTHAGEWRLVETPTLPAGVPRAIALDQSDADARQWLLRRTVDRIDVQSTPPASFHVWLRPGGELHLTPSPLTPPGDYHVGITVLSTAGDSLKGTVRAAVNTAPPLRRTGRPPVILLNGYQLVCFTVGPGSNESFDRLEELLRQDGWATGYFNNCLEGRQDIEVLGQRFAEYLAALRYDDGSPVDEVDVVAHSMGGLIVRAYLSGKRQPGSQIQNPPVASPPQLPRIRKQVFLSVPHFGVGSIIAPDTQAAALQPGSQFLWDLATWNQGGEDLRGVDTLNVIGVSSTDSDGLVKAVSAAASEFGLPAARQRVLPFCHTESRCNRPGQRSLQGIDSPDHESYRIIRSFFLDQTDWQSIGVTPDRDPGLTSNVGLYTTYASAAGVLLEPFNQFLATVVGGSQNLTLAGQRNSRVLWADNYSKQIFRVQAAAGGQTVSVTWDSRATFGTGLIALRPNPVITRVTTPLPAGRGRMLASGSNATILGEGLQGAEVLLDGTPLTIQSASASQIVVAIPVPRSGLARLTVRQGPAEHTVNVMIGEPCAYTPNPAQVNLPFADGEASLIVAARAGCPWTATADQPWLKLIEPAAGAGNGSVRFYHFFNPYVTPRTARLQIGGVAVTVTQAGSPQPGAPLTIGPVVNGASFQTGIAENTFFTIFGSNLAPRTRTWNVFDFNGDRLPRELDGVGVQVNGRDAYIYYISPTQVNALAPADPTVGNVQVQIRTASGTAAPVTAVKRRAMPALFLQENQRYAVATFADGTLVGRSAGRRPARSGESIVLWGTGFGPTEPIYPDGVLFPRALPLQSEVTATLAGQPAVVEFAGLVSPGLYQINIRVPALRTVDAELSLRVGEDSIPNGIQVPIE